MNKRLAKRHKREVSRARARVRISEPDVRTPEQVKAARDASRPADAASPYRNHRPAPVESAAQEAE